MFSYTAVRRHRSRYTSNDTSAVDKANQLSSILIKVFMILARLLLITYQLTQMVVWGNGRTLIINIEKSKCSTPKQVVAAVLVQRLIRTFCTFLQYAHCNKLSDGFRGTSHLLVKEWTEYIFVDVTGDIAVKLHVPLLLVFVLLAFTLAHQGRCGCEQSELLICSRFLEHIFGLDFYANLSIFLQITKYQRTIKC